mgnify:CR=1 FL=1
MAHDRLTLDLRRFFWIIAGVMIAQTSTAQFLLLDHAKRTYGLVNGDFERNNYDTWDVQDRCGVITIKNSDTRISSMTYEPIHDWVRLWIQAQYPSLTPPELDAFNLNIGKRAEIRLQQAYGESDWNGKAGTTVWYSWRFRFPVIPVVNTGGIIITQLHSNYPKNSSPPIAFTLRDGMLRCGTNVQTPEATEENPISTHVPIMADGWPLQANTWYTIKLKVEWRTTPSGDVQIFIREGNGGFQEVNYYQTSTGGWTTLKNINGYYEPHDFKLGIYDSAGVLKDFLLNDPTIPITNQGPELSTYNNLINQYLSSTYTFTMQVDDVQVARTEADLDL